VNFTRNVFVNCPFDNAYLPLLRPLLFTVIYLGLKPRIAFESLDSGKPRIDKIVKMIKASRLAIHDLSRCQAEKKGEYFRLNMPFELGIDVGCRLFGAGAFNSKRCLILEVKRFRFQAAISDLSGSDIAAHRNQPRVLVAAVRNWLSNHIPGKFAGPTQVFDAFNEFMLVNFEDLSQRGFSKRDIDKLPIHELIDCMTRWILKAHNAA